MRWCFVQLTAVEALAMVFAIVGAATGKLPDSEGKGDVCDPFIESDYTKDSCSYYRGQETACAFNIITAIICGASAVAVGVSLFVPSVYDRANGPMKVINILCALFELVALIVLPATFNTMGKHFHPRVYFFEPDTGDWPENFASHLPDSASFFSTTLISMVLNFAAVVCLSLFK